MEVNHRDWEQRGGTIISTTASNGRIRRTFVSPSGEKFRSWKECEKYLASVNSSSDMDKTSDESGNCKAKAIGGKKGAKNQASTDNGDGNSENENHESPANKMENGEEAEDKKGKLKYDSKAKESAVKNGKEDCNGNVQKSSPKNGVQDNSAKEKSSSSDCKIISQKSDSSDFEEVASKNSNEKTKKSGANRAKAVDSAKSSKKRNRDEKVPPKSGKKRTNEAAEIEENEKKRKMPKRAAACDDFREEKEPLRLRKEDCVIESKKEKVVEEEDTAVKMTFDSADEPVIPPQRRLTDFIVHDFKGESQPIEMSDVTDMFITGIILPIAEDADKEKGVRCEGFGLISTWSITGYEEGVPSIWLSTSHAEYLCVKPSPQYKQFFDVLYEKTSLCVEVYRALSKPDGGDPLLGLDDMVARVVRSMNRKKSSSSRIYGREYLVTHGEFVANQLFELDNNPSDSDQLFTGLPALVALENECRSLNRRINNTDQRNGAIRINESGSASSAVVDAAEDMDEDEKLARLLQEQEEFKSSRQQRKSNKKKFYIKMNETEIVNDYPLPDYYKSTEDETDEYLFFDDTPMDPEDLPRRMLHEWTLYNAESRIVPLELIPMLPNMETDVDVFGSGIMTEDDGSGYCLEGDSEGRSSKLEEPQGIRIYLSAIKEWMIEFGANMLFISIRTDGAWYRLGKPSKQYSPWYQPVLKTARLAIRIITMLKEQSRASKLSFADVIRKLTEQRKNEPTYISANLVDVERYIVVHGQIILQQFAEYPDEMVRRSAFVTGLSHKMEKRQHTKLVHIETDLIIKDKNLNPRATIRPDLSRPKQMHATTTKLIYRIWNDYYSNSGTQEETEAKEIVEQDEQEQSDDDDEIVIAAETKSRGTSQVKTGRTKSTKIGEWVGNSNGNLSSGEALYRKALANGVVVAVGGAVLIDSYGPDDLAVILFVEYLYEKSDGTKMMHGRVLERASQTVLGNAGNDLEVFLTMNCSDVSLDSVKESVSLNIQIKPWGHKYRKEGTEAQEKKKVSSGYYCKSFYVPEKGAFFTLPFDTLGLGSGKCHACIERKAEKQEFELFKSKDGFTYKGVDYCVQDFVYVDPGELPSFGDAQEVEKFKGGMNKGLRAFAICQILEVKTGSAFKSDSNSTKVSVRRFFRPEDVGPEKAYHADIKEVYYSEETCLVYVNGIRGKCEVKRQQYYAGYATCPIMDHIFWCNCIFDPSKGTVKQLPANVKFHTSKANITSKGKSPASNMNAKAKGKAVLVEASDEYKAENQDDDRLATLDIFAGCGGLSHGLKQSGACVTKWAVEYEQPAADAFKLNHPEAEVFCDNCNVILRAIMDKGGDESDCIATNEAADMAAKLSVEQKRALPVPGQVDFINGGPPCQGFSGMNRFNTSAWSKVQCEMILAFLSYADYFRPKFFLLENVRNFVSFNKGQTFRLTLASLLEMGYQVRFGVLQAGNYGVSQSRKRAFIWAASPDELLPEWPEPMHVFATPQLKISLPGGKQYAAVRDASNGAPLRSITVRDTIGDLPAVGNGADKHEMKYQDDPLSWFQKQIRADQSILIDHISKEMNELNLIRCQHIPKRPGADWRDLPTEKVKLSTGQMVDLIPWCLPNTAERHNQWKGLFGRLDWEGNFPTSITDPQPMGKVGMCFHPEQDRIVTVRECARSQGFPDHYKFCGTIHHRHRQIGNAVPPPLAAALGFKLKQALDTKKNNH